MSESQMREVLAKLRSLLDDVEALLAVIQSASVLTSPGREQATEMLRRLKDRLRDEHKRTLTAKGRAGLNLVERSPPGDGVRPARRAARLEHTPADPRSMETVCLECGSPVQQTAGGRPRLYCSNRCRQAAPPQARRSWPHPCRPPRGGRQGARRLAPASADGGPGCLRDARGPRHRRRLPASRPRGLPAAALALRGRRQGLGRSPYLLLPRARRESVAHALFWGSAIGTSMLHGRDVDGCSAETRGHRARLISTSDFG